MGTLTCKIRQRVQKLHSEKSRCFAQKQRKLETSKIRVFCPRGSFNQRARDSSSLEHTKIPRKIVRFLVGFSIFWGSAHFCTPAGKPCFSLHCLHSVHRGGTCRGEVPPSCWRKTVLLLKSLTGAFIAALRSQTRIFHTFFRRTAGGRTPGASHFCTAIFSAAAEHGGRRPVPPRSRCRRPSAD